MKKFVEEFKTFISRGNVVDMAVGVIIGGAFTTIVNSLVKDVFMPFISFLTGGLDFSAWKLVIGTGPEPATLNFGTFVSAVINFLLIALVLFCIIKFINKMRRKPEQAPAAPPTKTCPYCRSEIPLEATRCPHCTSALEEEAPASKGA